jgi:SAM-dependent methyltransferase
MHIDQDRVRAVIQAEHAFYGPRPDIRKDNRWYRGVTNLITPELAPGSRVLDVGCGDGAILLELSARFHAGLGIDLDPEHLKLAQAAKRAQGAQNVEFLLLDYPREVARLQPETFDLVFSMRGPLADTPAGIQAARHLLRPDGLLLCEAIGELHQKEKRAIFDPGSLNQVTVRKVDELRRLIEQNGFDVRLAADLFDKWIYTDVYAWLQFECNIRAWLGVPLPEPDDPRIALFAEQNTTATGEIATTHHVVWVAGVKKNTSLSVV